jgi:hypothetical protein
MIPTKGPVYAEMALAGRDDDCLPGEMLAHPILMNRPEGANGKDLNARDWVFYPAARVYPPKKVSLLQGVTRKRQKEGNKFHGTLASV